MDAPPAVFKARVNQTSFDYPLTQVSFDGVSLGAYSDIEKGMTVLFGTTEGADDLGRHRIRKAATSNTIYIGEASRGTRDGEVDLENDAWIVVINEFRLWTYAPFIDPASEIIYKDYDIPISEGGRNYGSRPGPIANGGCKKADLIDPDTSVATFEFDSDNSLYVTPGSSAASVLWDVGDGTIITGTSSSAQITATFPEGRRYVNLLVTDDNGDTREHNILTVALNPTGATLRPILDFEITDHRLAVEGGELSVIVYEDIDPADYPEGAAVIYFEHEYYDGVKGSLAGPSGDEHIKFVGWLDTESESPTATLRGIENGVELRVISSAEKLRQLNLFPQRVDDSDSPATWTQMDTPTPERFMLYLLMWHSTVCDVDDVLAPDFGSAYEGIQVQASTLYDQVDEIAQENARRFTCDQRDTLRIVDNPLLLDSGDRTSTVIVALTEGDIQSYSLGRQRAPREYWIDASAITVGDSQVRKFSRAPGDAPGQGATRSEFARQLVADQTELNARVGHEYARRNTPWEPLGLQMVNTGDAGIDPALTEWIEVTTAAAKNKRQRALTDERCLPSEVRIEHSNDGRGVKEVEYIALIETVGTPGATYIPKTDPQAKLPAYQFPQFELFPPTWEAPSANQGVDFTSAPAMYAATPSGIYRNRDEDEPSISWETIFDPATDVAANYTVENFRLDPWSPKNTAFVSVANRTTNQIRLYCTEDLNDASPTWSLEHSIDLSSYDAVYGMDLSLSINIEGYIGLAYAHNSAVIGTYYMYDYRLTPISSWQSVQVANEPSGADERALAVGTHAVYPNGDIYMATAQNNVFGHQEVYKSDDLGATWTYDQDLTGRIYAGGLATHAIAIPYLNNPGDETVWFFFYNPDSADCIIRREADGSYTFGLGKIDDAAVDYFTIPNTSGALNAAKRSVDIWTGNANYVRYVSANQNGKGFDQLVYSRNAGGVWEEKNLPSGTFWGLGGWPNDSNILFAWGDGVLYWSSDGGDTWNDLRGDGVSADDLFVLASNNTMLEFVPVWVP